jgi:hypothetical protein
MLMYLSCVGPGPQMALSDCINIKIKLTESHEIDKAMKKMGFEYAREFMPSLIYTKNFNNQLYYFEFQNTTENNFMNILLFRPRDRNERDDYCTTFLIPYLKTNFGTYTVIAFPLSKIYNGFDTRIIYAKFWNLKDKNIYLLEKFYDMTINLNIDLLFIEMNNSK